MENESIDYGALFGVSGEMSGANGQEVAAPAETGTEDPAEEGENEQAVAEPAVGEELPGNNTAEAERGTEPTAAEEKGGEGVEPAAGEGRRPQTSEENAGFAAARRRAEQERDAALAREREAHTRQMDALVAEMGLVNPETGKAVKTKAEYDAFLAATNAQKQRELRKRMGVSEAEWSEMIEQSPEIAQAREVTRRAAAAEQAARVERIRGELLRDVAEIVKLDGEVKTLEDIRALDSWGEIEAKMKRGYSMLDAYKLANMDKLSERRAAAARQQAINATAQKQHMQRTEQRGAGGVVVPADVKTEYLTFNPEATDAEIAAHYARYTKK